MILLKSLKKQFFFLVTLFSFVPFNLSAMEVIRFSDVPVENDIVVSPAKVEMSLDPGAESTHYLKVINRMGQDVAFSIDVQDFASTNDSHGGVALGETIPGVQSSLRDYIRVDKIGFTLAHGEQARIPVTVELPKDIIAGGRYAAVLVSGSPTKNASGSTKVITQLGVMFFVKVIGTVDKSGQFKDVAFRDGKIEIVFENDGDIYLNPYGIINIYGYSEIEMSTVMVDPWFVLPKSTRTRTIAIGDLPVGRYNASISINRGYDDVVDVRSIGFDVGMSPDRRFNIIWLALFVGILLWLIYKFYLWREKITK